MCDIWVVLVNKRFRILKLIICPLICYCYVHMMDFEGKFTNGKMLIILNGFIAFKIFKNVEI